MSTASRFLEKDRIKSVMSALEDTVHKLRHDIEYLQKEGKQPHDYSLGFTNGVIFAEHNLRGRGGKPKFYMQKTAIGELPRPVRFEQNKEDITEIATYKDKLRLLDDIIYNLEKEVDDLPLNSKVALKKYLEFMQSQVDSKNVLSLVKESANGDAPEPRG